MCKKCDQLFGTPTDSCYVKDHNVVECSSDSAEDESIEANSVETNAKTTEILQRDNSLPPIVLIHVF